MNKEAMIKRLTEIVGEDNVLTDRESCLEMAKDYNGYRHFQRDSGNNMVNQAACVVNVHSTEEVQAVLKFLNESKVDVTPRAGGSSVTKSIEPEVDGVILNCREMSGILEVNTDDMYVTAKAGTPLEYMEYYLNEMGYTCGHFPQSFPMASLGGLLATRSIGQFSTLYGGIEDLVLALEAVMPDGEIIRIKNVPRRSVGPDLRHLFIGSEGMTGYITEVTMKIFKYNPETRWMRAYGVSGIDEGIATLKEIIQEGYKPAVARLHDPDEVEKILKIDAPANTAMLMFLCEGPAEINRVTGEAIDAIAKKHGAIDFGTKPLEHWLIHRNDACHESIVKPIYYNKGIVLDTCEVSANWSQIPALYKAVTGRVREEIDNIYFIGAHSSHSYMTGTNLYFEFPFFVTDPAPQAVEDEYYKILTIIMEEVLRHGGSIAHHHGSGKYRTRWMPEEHGTSYPLMYKLKEALDPNGVMNKGVILVDKES